MTHKEALNRVLQAEYSNYQYMKMMRGHLGCFNCLFRTPCNEAYKNNKFRSCGEFINEYLDSEFIPNGN